MIIHAARNIRESFYNLGGTVWQAFLLPKSFDPETIDTVTVDYLIANHQGVIALELANESSAILKFGHRSVSMVNTETGLELTEPLDDGQKLYRVGITAIKMPSLYTDYFSKFKILFPSAGTLSCNQGNTSVEERTMEFTLKQPTRIDKINMYQSAAVESTKVFTTEWVDYVPGLVASKISIVLKVNAAYTLGDISVYTKDATAVSDVMTDIGYAVITPNKLIDLVNGKPPLLLVDASNWDGSGTMILGKAVNKAALCPPMIHFTLTPQLLEV